ncbi:OmpH family outer membrane protein [Flavobacterium sp.]|uniref:OmpH family outer membrane protein n=1 Tax=Flavobacterium sp. TaxID=239 RepID=UPI00120B6209|nr:OmpH family outer membrane protein [Flavobacterium sp.]RZJ71931.1 MAG: OmpH family outer membrane protein [Flavobacterium sp.]
MKKTLAIVAIAIAMASCNKDAQQAQFKTAYVDTEKLMKESVEMKDLEAKYKTKGDEMSKELKAEAERFQKDAAAFQAKAQQLGQIWAQQNSGPLAQRQQQLQYAQEGILRQLQSESGVEQDSLVSRVEKFLKDFGKEKGYDYVFGTGASASVLYAKDQYNITDEVIKALNAKYEKDGKKPAANDQAKVEATPAEKK